MTTVLNLCFIPCTWYKHIFFSHKKYKCHINIFMIISRMLKMLKILPEFSEKKFKNLIFQFSLHYKNHLFEVGQCHINFTNPKTIFIH